MLIIIADKKKDGLLQAEEKVSREKANDIMKRIIDNSNQWNKKV